MTIPCIKICRKIVSKLLSETLPRLLFPAVTHFGLEDIHANMLISPLRVLRAFVVNLNKNEHKLSPSSTRYFASSFCVPSSTVTNNIKNRTQYICTESYYWTKNITNITSTTTRITDEHIEKDKIEGDRREKACKVSPVMIWPDHTILIICLYLVHLQELVQTGLAIFHGPVAMQIGCEVSLLSLKKYNQELKLYRQE